MFLTYLEGLYSIFVLAMVVVAIVSHAWKMADFPEGPLFTKCRQNIRGAIPLSFQRTLQVSNKLCYAFNFIVPLLRHPQASSLHSWGWGGYVEMVTSFLEQLKKINLVKAN